MKKIKKSALLALTAALFLPAASGAADKAVKPTITASIEYNDNILASRSDREEDYITRILPGLTAGYEGPRIQLSASYYFHWINFSRHSDLSLDTHKAALNMNAEILRNAFFLKVTNDYGRVSKDIARERVQESFILDQTDSNVFTVEPYLILRPSAWTRIRAGYRFSDYWYKDEDSVDKKDSAVFAFSSFELSPRSSAGIRAEYLRQTNRIEDFDRAEAAADLKYEYANGAAAIMSIGYSKILFDDGRTAESSVWNAAVNHDFGRARLAFKTSGNLIEDPNSVPKFEYSYVVTAAKDFGSRTVITASHHFSDYYNSETEKRETRKYGITAGIQHDFSSRLRYTASLRREKFVLYLQDATSFRTSFSQALAYALGENVSAKLMSNFIDYESTVLEADNHETNRVTAEISAAF